MRSQYSTSRCRKVYRRAAFTKQPKLTPRLGRNKNSSQAALGTQRAREKSAAAFRSKVSKEQSTAMKFPLKFFLFAPVILISLALAACSGPVGSGSVGTGGGGGGTGGPFTIGGTVSGLAAGASMTLQNNGAESLV